MKLASLLMFCALVSSSAFAAKAATGADAVAIDQACASDAATAGCGSEQVGTGLLRCLGAYKKAHRKDFKFSEGCKSAMKKARADRAAKKAE